MNVIYKLYSMLLLSRLTRELDDKNYLPDNQAAYRKGRSTINNIYVADKIVKSRIERGLKTFALFLDLKAAFDNVDRRRLFVKLKKVLSKYLVTAIEDIYELTPIRIGDMGVVKALIKAIMTRKLIDRDDVGGLSIGLPTLPEYPGHWRTRSISRRRSLGSFCCMAV